ncbi:hypothetical protein [uncultured Croceitalea sp.]
MKRVLSILAIAVMTVGFYSCETESTTEEEQLFINANDDDNGEVKDRG